MVAFLVDFSKESFTGDGIMITENIFLNSLQWRMHPPTPKSYSWICYHSTSSQGMLACYSIDTIGTDQVPTWIEHTAGISMRKSRMSQIWYFAHNLSAVFNQSQELIVKQSRWLSVWMHSTLYKNSSATYSRRGKQNLPLYLNACQDCTCKLFFALRGFILAREIWCGCD